MTTLMFAVWGAGDLRGASLRDALAEVGVENFQVNLSDADVDGALALQHLETPIESVLRTTGGDASDVLAILNAYAHQVVGWEVDARVPLPPPRVGNGNRAHALANLAFIRRPETLPYDAWLAHWHGPHTAIAMETQGTVGYVQNRVLAPLTPGTPHVDAIVEELFPMAALTDMHAFYGSGGDDAELTRRITRLMESVATLGADHDIDLVPTSRYVWEL
jgi:hypothetical protein